MVLSESPNWTFHLFLVSPFSPEPDEVPVKAPSASEVSCLLVLSTEASTLWIRFLSFTSVDVRRTLVLWWRSGREIPVSRCPWLTSVLVPSCFVVWWWTVPVVCALMTPSSDALRVRRSVCHCLPPEAAWVGRMPFLTSASNAAFCLGFFRSKVQVFDEPSVLARLAPTPVPAAATPALPPRVSDAPDSTLTLFPDSRFTVRCLARA